MTNSKIPLIDFHTDFILGEANLGQKLFNVDTSKQINKNLTEKAGVSLLFAGFSYDDEKNCTETMLSEMEKFVKKEKPKFKIIFHLEGAQILARDQNLLVKFFKRGVRSIGIAHTHDNNLCGSSSSDKNLGLTPFGKKIIKEAIKLGMVIDFAHMSRKSFFQALKLISKPPIMSHTACFSVEQNPRNTKDEQIIEIAKRKGIIGIFFSGKYINSKKQPTVEDVIKHIDHVVKVAGINHVAIGSDFGGITTGQPTGLESVDKIQHLFEKLKDKGYSDKGIEKIAYKNAKRVLSIWMPNFEVQPHLFSQQTNT